MKKNTLIKRIKAGFLATMLGMSLVLGGCGGSKPEEDDDVKQEQTKPKQDEVKVDVIIVDNATDLINAITPGANIVIKEGTYNMTAEINAFYGNDKGESFNKSHPYVQLEEVFDDGTEVEVRIQNVDGLTISANGSKYVELQIEPRFARVFAFDGCENVTLKNLTLGHTEGAGCTGDVLGFGNCNNMTLDHVDLYGCGAYGFYAYETNNFTVKNSVIRDCTAGILSMVDCTNFNFESTKMYGCKGDYMINLARDTGVFNKCSFYNNDFYTFIDDYDYNEIQFKGCDFGLEESKAVDWGSFGGEYITFDDACIFSGEALGTPNTVYVSNTEEFLEAIADNTTIMLQPDTYNISEYLATVIDSDCLAWNNAHQYLDAYWYGDMLALDIVGVNNLSIIANSYDGQMVEIVTSSPSADVLNFEYCNDIYLEQLSLGHLIPAGGCQGNVISLYNCKNVSMSMMDLYGCGVFGIWASNSGNVTVSDADFHDCSSGAMCISDMTGPFTYNYCTFNRVNDVLWSFDVPTYSIEFYDCYFGINEWNNVTMDDRVSLYNCDSAYSTSNGSSFYDMDDLIAIDVPENILPDFWYGICTFDNDGYRYNFPLVDSNGSEYFINMSLYDDHTGYIYNLGSNGSIDEILWSIDYYGEHTSVNFIPADANNASFEGVGVIYAYQKSDGYMRLHMCFNDCSYWFY